MSNTADSGAGSLRDTIAASGSGDTINFSVTGTITLTSGTLTVSHNLTIQGPGATSLTITRSSSTHFRVLTFSGSGTWTVSDLTLDNGYDDVSGGGIFNASGTLTVNNCIIQNCLSGQKGGGIGTSWVTTLNNVFFIHNQCGFAGGGGVFNDSNLTVNNCTFSDNVSAGNGGGLCNAGFMSVTNSTFNDNTASGGGGIFNQDFEASTVKNCTFSNNHGAGNAIRLGGGTLTVQSCTLSGNVSEPGGSIELASGATLTIGNTILDGRGSTYSALYVSSGTVNSQGYNLTTDDGGGLLNATGDQINTDPKLDPFGLQYNGGYTDTIALTNISPAIDKGKSFGLTSDQRGLARTVDNPNYPNASGGDGTDIGAYEASLTPIQYGLIVNTTADHDDGVCDSDCTLREAIARAATLSTSTPPVISFAIGLTGTIHLNINPIELDISTSMTILGPGARFLAVSGSSAARVFNVTGGTVIISGLTIRDGNYFTNQSNGETRQGGGVFNQANLTFNDCEFVNNTIDGASNSTTNGGNGGTGQGGAVYNRSSLTLNRCMFSGNQAVGAAGNTFSSSQVFGAGGNGGAGQGSAVFNDGGGTANISNCTFNGNAAVGGPGGAGNSQTIHASGGNADGAICNFGTMTVDSATVSGNSSTGGAGAGSRFSHGPNGGGSGGFSAKAGSSRILNTILAGNTGTATDAQGAFLSQGFNLIGIGDQSSGWSSSSGDQVGTATSPLNAHLSALGNNGGPTDTMLLLYGSTAIDAGSTHLTNDQRGFARPIYSGFPTNGSFNAADIGAVEMDLIGGIDTDGDGMSDDFEKFYGFNPNNASDATLDSDGDGLTNLQEFEADTNPLDPTSALRITDMIPFQGELAIGFGTIRAGKTYRLERKDAITDTSWNPISGVPDLIADHNGTDYITDPTAGTKHFYRVRLVQ